MTKFPWVDAPRFYPRGPQRLYPDIGASVASIAPAPLWSPYSLGSNVIFWFDANSTPGNSGDLLGVWSNFSTAGSHAYQATSSQRPQIVTSYFNGRNVVMFPGSQFFKLTLELYSTPPAAATIYEVKRSNINSGYVDGARVVGNHWLGASSENFPVNHYPWSDGVIYDGTFAKLRKTIGDIAQDLRSMHLNAMYSASGDFKMLINASSAFVTTTNCPAYSDEPKLGQSELLASTNSHYFYGQIHQLIITNTVLSSGNNAKMEGYVMHASGLQSLLPGGHPYVNSPPT